MKGPEFGPREEDWTDRIETPNVSEEQLPVYEAGQLYGTIFDSAEIPASFSGSIELPRKFLSGKELNEALSCADFDVWTFGQDTKPGENYFRGISNRS